MRKYYVGCPFKIVEDRGVMIEFNVLSHSYPLSLILKRHSGNNLNDFSLLPIGPVFNINMSFNPPDNRVVL